MASPACIAGGRTYFGVTVVTPALGAGHPVDRVHRSRVPGGNPRFSPTISEVKATDQQRPAQAPTALRKDYSDMTMMIFGEAPMFNLIVDSLQQLEDQIKRYRQMLCIRRQAAFCLTPSTKGTPSMTSAIS